MTPTYWEPRLRHQFPPEYNLLIYWRITFTVAGLCASGAGLLWAQAAAAREAAAGRAFIISAPQPWPLAAVAGGMLLCIPAAAVLYILLNDTPRAVRAVLWHDAFHCILPLLLLYGAHAYAPVTQPAVGLMAAVVGLSGVLAAEGVWVALRARRLWWAVGLALGAAMVLALAYAVLAPLAG